MSEKDGGPAFPHLQATVEDEVEDGMSLRDYFAGHALAGTIATYSGRDCSLPLGAVYAASLAYKYADAMLVAREKKTDEVSA